MQRLRLKVLSALLGAVLTLTFWGPSRGATWCGSKKRFNSSVVL